MNANTASRTLSIGGADHTLGVLVQANHGLREWFTVLGVPIGKHWPEGRLFDTERGSIIVVIACDLPMLPHQLERLAQRASIGIGRHGTPGGNNSGDLFLAFSTANAVPLAELTSAPRRMKVLPDDWFDPIYLAAVQAIDEAVVNAMLAAESMTTLKPAGLTCQSLEAQRLVALLGTGGA